VVLDDGGEVLLYETDGGRRDRCVCGSGSPSGAVGVYGSTTTIGYSCFDVCRVTLVA